MEKQPAKQYETSNSSAKPTQQSHKPMQAKRVGQSPQSETPPRNEMIYDPPSMEAKMPRPSYYNSSKPSWPELVESDDSDMETDIDVEKLPPLEVGPHENRLQHTYWLWFSRKGAHRAMDYSKSLRVVGRCASVQQWWSLYSHLKRPTALSLYLELSLFKQGIKPMWEDPANSKGGQWVIRLRKNQIDRAWENVCMAMLGEQFLVGDEICGVVLTTKVQPVEKKKQNTEEEKNTAGTTYSLYLFARLCSSTSNNTLNYHLQNPLPQQKRREQRYHQPSSVNRKKKQKILKFV
ncbi:Eukaryotic translation initiation factor 4E type 2 [Lucilia cuprina]|nr:Eukaryotic translation initiation factor 4E type 2 [Lucilia cuprina]